MAPLELRRDAKAGKTNAKPQSVIGKWWTDDLVKMTFVHKYISTIILAGGLLLSCSTPDDEKVADLTPESDNNKFPIEYVGNKVLDYNKPVIPPDHGPARPSDTFSIYKLVNKSLDTVWVNTIKDRQDTSWYFVKDTSIKEITIDRISYRRIDLKSWMSVSDGNCWGNCDFRMKLLPGQSLPFRMGMRYPNYDSTQFVIYLKIKKGQKTIDSTVAKRLVFMNDHFVDDLNKWRK